MGGGGGVNRSAILTYGSPPHSIDVLNKYNMLNRNNYNSNERELSMCDQFAMLVKTLIYPGWDDPCFKNHATKSLSETTSHWVGFTTTLTFDLYLCWSYRGQWLDHLWTAMHMSSRED